MTSEVLDSNIPLKCHVYCPGFGKALLQYRVIDNMHEDKLPGVGWGQEGDSPGGKKKKIKSFNHSTRHATLPYSVRAALRWL